MASITEMALQQIIASRLMDKGLSTGDAYRISKQPWAMQLAQDKLAGRPSPPGMDKLTAQDIPKYKARAEAAGVRIEDIFQSDFLGKPYKGQVAGAVGQGAKAVAQALPPMGQARLAEQINPISQAAQQPPASASGLMSAKAGPIGNTAATDFGWLFNGGGKKPYTLTANDLSPKMINKIAGEALANNPESVDAVIHNILNRVGGEGFSGKTDSMYDVAFSPGQYTGNRKPGAEEAAMIKSRLEAIASGQVPDPTGGSTEYRAASYVKGEGRGKDFAQRAASGDYQNIGENVFGVMPGTKPGPYAGLGYQLAKTPDEMVSSLGGAEGVNPIREMFAPTGPSASGSAGMAHLSPSAQFSAASQPLMAQGATGSANQFPSASASVDASPMSMPLRKPSGFAPPMPTPNPLRGTPQISATGEVGAVNGGLPAAPAYAKAQFAPPAPPMPTRNPLRNVTAQAFGATGMPNQMPSAMGSAQFGPQVSASVGAMNGGLPPAPAFGQASFGVPSALAHLVGRSPMPAAQTMSPMPSMAAPRLQGFGMTNATGLTSPFAGGLGMNPMSAALASMRAAPVMPNSLMGGGTNLQGASPFAGGFGSPAMPMAGTAAARSRAMPTMPQPGAPQAPAAYGAGAAGMGAAFGTPGLGLGKTSSGPAAGGFAPGSWGNASNAAKLQDIGASYSRGATALSAAINRGLQGFRANRAGNIAGRRASANVMMAFPQTRQMLGGSQVTGYGYL
jgi:hypothetical protein